MKHLSTLRVAVLASLASFLGACAEVPYQAYHGTPMPESQVATVRLWTPTTTDVFTSPGLIMEKIDGLPAGDVGRASHAYLLPGEHDFEVRFIQVKAMGLLCGALCTTIFDKPYQFKATAEAGKIYVLKYVNDANASVVLEEKGANFDKTCLKAREYTKERCD